MTHTLHRMGNFESLKDDYVWQVYPSKGVNDFDVPQRLNKVIDIVTALGSPNWGDVYSGCILFKSVNEIRERLEKGSKLRGIFTTKDKLETFLVKMREEDIGFSVTISGLFEEIFAVCRRLHIKPHSVNLSLGTWGKKELLPPEELLNITTMCGHSLISPNLVQKLLEEAKEKGQSPEEISLRLAELCPCGVFNHVRAAKLIRNLALKNAEGKARAKVD